MELNEALEELRKKRKRKFSQSFDLIINLKDLDLRKENINIVVNLPHKIKNKKVCAFLEKKSDIIDTITKPEFKKYSDKKILKKLVREYDYFISLAPLMPTVAATFGRVLGPAGKMPSPQLGIIPQDKEEIINSTLDKISKAIKIRVKEASIKLSVGKEEMTNEQIMENIKTIHKEVIKTLPKNKDNIKNILIKLTMTKPLKIDLN